MAEGVGCGDGVELLGFVDSGVVVATGVAGWAEGGTGVEIGNGVDVGVDVGAVGEAALVGDPSQAARAKIPRTKIKIKNQGVEVLMTTV
ncbi:MAG: hypothetical protein IH860_02245 [Chloroflexi bacterium]|nr:hypothetical protein [Chloroflexota bacterium]